MSKSQSIKESSCFPHPCRVAAKTVTLQARQAHSFSSSSFASRLPFSHPPRSLPALRESEFICFYWSATALSAALSKTRANCYSKHTQMWKQVLSFIFIFLHTVNTWVVYAGVWISKLNQQADDIQTELWPCIDSASRVCVCWSEVASLAWFHLQVIAQSYWIIMWRWTNRKSEEMCLYVTACAYSLEKYPSPLKNTSCKVFLNYLKC